MRQTPTLPEFDRLVRDHQASLQWYLLYLGADQSQVPDLLQDTFLRLLAASFEERSPAATRAWLRRTARHLLLQEQRRVGQEPWFAQAEGVEEAWIDFEAQDDGAGYLEALRLCLQELQASSRQVIELRYTEGLSRRQVAARVGRPEGGVKTLLERARQALRACVQRRRR